MNYDGYTFHNFDAKTFPTEGPCSEELRQKKAEVIRADVRYERSPVSRNTLGNPVPGRKRRHEHSLNHGQGAEHRHKQ